MTALADGRTDDHDLLLHQTIMADFKIEFLFFFNYCVSYVESLLSKHERYNIITPDYVMWVGVERPAKKRKLTRHVYDRGGGELFENPLAAC